MSNLNKSIEYISADSDERDKNAVFMNQSQRNVEKKLRKDIQSYMAKTQIKIEMDLLSQLKLAQYLERQWVYALYTGYPLLDIESKHKYFTMSLDKVFSNQQKIWIDQSIKSFKDDSIKLKSKDEERFRDKRVWLSIQFKPKCRQSLFWLEILDGNSLIQTLRKIKASLDIGAQQEFWFVVFQRKTGRRKITFDFN